MDRDLLKQELSLDEARRKFAYDDADGNPPTVKGKLTIGVGWNLTDNGLPDDLIDRLLDLGIDQACALLDHIWPGWRSALNDARQRALVNMAFNLGPRLESFPHFLAALKGGDYSLAAENLMDSLWHKQVGQRAERIEQTIRIGA